MAIDRYISYRVRDTRASLAFLLFPGEPDAAGRYVLLATDDLLDGEPPSEALCAAGRRPRLVRQRARPHARRAGGGFRRGAAALRVDDRAGGHART